jgi:hypothetical protein
MVSMTEKLGRIFGITHLSFVVILGYFIATSNDGESGMAWFIFAIVDFPISFLLMPLNELIGLIECPAPIGSNGNYLPLSDYKQFWLPASFFGVVGSIWWYYMPAVVKYCLGLPWK